MLTLLATLRKMSNLHFNLYQLHEWLQANNQRLRGQANPLFLIVSPAYDNLDITIIIFELMQAKAIPFIVKDFTHDTYHLTAEAESLLSRINTPVSVVTVAGLYRTGKSYLLNRVILNRAGGFGVGPTVNPCTKGLWIWSEPIHVSGRTLLVVDTEGLGALDEESNHDMKIFCLAVLLSSNFIYNSVGSIDQPALQTLSLVLNLISGIDKESYSSRPSFLWIVRDFSLQLINEKGQQITPSQYLQFALSTQNQKQPQKLQLRKTITESFTERECFTLIKPLIDETKLQNLDKVSTDELRPEFISQTIALRKYIYQSLKEVKLNNSTPLRGNDYMLMCKKFLDAINTGAVPDMLDTWGYIKEEKARQVTEVVRENYTQKLRNRLGNKVPMPTARLGELLLALRNEALEQFTQMCYEDASNQELKEFLTASETEMQRLNAKQCKSTLNEILRRQFQPFQKKLLSNYYSDATSYQHDLRNTFRTSIQEKYSERIELPPLEIELYAEKRIIEGVKMFQKRSRDELTRARESRSQVQGNLQNQIRNLNRVFDEERRKFQQQIFQCEKKIIIITNEKQRLQENSTKEKRDQEAEVGRVRRKAEESQQQLEGMKREQERMERVNGEQSSQMFMLKKELETERALYKQKSEYLESSMADSSKKLTDLQQQIQVIQKTWENDKKETIMHWEGKYDFLAKEKKEISDYLAEMSNQLQQERFNAQQWRLELEAAKDKYQDEVNRYKERFASSAKKDSSRSQNEGEIYRELQETRKRNDILSEELKDSELRTRQLHEQLKLFKSQSQKQEAIASQRIEFQQLQNQQLRAKLAQANNAYQRFIDAAQINNTLNIELQYKRKIKDIEAENLRNMKEIESECDNKIAMAKREVSQCLKEKDDLQLQMNLQQKRWEEREKSLQNTIEFAKKENQDLKRRINNTEEDHAESQREKETYFSIRVRQLETEIEEVKRQASMELEDIAQKSEETVAFIKSCSEKEKSQFQKRLEEEREKKERKVRETIEEWSQKVSEEKEHYEGMISQLEGRLAALNEEYSDQLQAIKCDADIRIQKVNNAALQERMDLAKKYALLQQQAEITKTNLTAQLQEKTRQYVQATESLKKQLHMEFQQQIRAAKEVIEELEGRLDSLKKVNRKSQESNLLIKSELDKEKALNREKEQASSRRFKQIQERFADELRNNTKIIEEMNQQHTLQNRKLNEEIERLKELVTRIDSQRTKLQAQHQDERNSLITRYNYMETKCKRSKDDYEDLLKKFQTTVKTLSKNTKEIKNKEERLVDQCQQRIRQKGDTVNEHASYYVDKSKTLQKENKVLRDKMLALELRANNHSSRYEQDPEPERQDRALRDIRVQNNREGIQAQTQQRRYYH